MTDRKPKIIRLKCSNRHKKVVWEVDLSLSKEAREQLSKCPCGRKGIKIK